MAQTPTQVSKSPHPLEAFIFGNLGQLVLDVHHPSPGPNAADTSSKTHFPKPPRQRTHSMAKSLNLAGDSKPRHSRRGMPRRLILACAWQEVQGR
jgi:hypothetical protein